MESLRKRQNRIQVRHEIRLELAYVIDQDCHVNRNVAPEDLGIDSENGHNDHNRRYRIMESLRKQQDRMRFIQVRQRCGWSFAYVIDQDCHVNRNVAPENLGIEAPARFRKRTQ